MPKRAQCCLASCLAASLARGPCGGVSCRSICAPQGGGSWLAVSAASGSGRLWMLSRTVM
eukprot:866044-Pelagomonas_calceolata.AAC.6